MRIVVAAQESAGVQAVRLAHAGPHELVAVLTDHPLEDARRGATVAGVAETLGYPVWPAALVKSPDLADTLRRERVDVFLNVHSLYLVHADVLAAVSVGAFNLHPGPLPSYAGMNAPSWALFAGETEHAVTVHWMEPGIDTGAIAFERPFPIGATDTGLTVAAACTRLGVQLLGQLLATSPDDIPRVQQDLSLRRYHGRNVPFDGWIPWEQSAREIERLARACDYSPLPSPWGTPRTRRGDHVICVAKVVLTYEPCEEAPGTVDGSGDRLRVATGDEWLEVRTVVVDGNTVPASEVLVAGDRLLSGPRPTPELATPNRRRR